MNSPLKFDAEIVKKFGIPDVEGERKLNFARNQLDQQEAVLLRERYELIVDQAQVDDAEDDIMKNQYATAVTNHNLTIKQMVRSVKVLTQLVKELEEELASAK